MTEDLQAKDLNAEALETEDLETENLEVEDLGTEMDGIKRCLRYLLGDRIIRTTPSPHWALYQTSFSRTTRHCERIGILILVGQPNVD